MRRSVDVGARAHVRVRACVCVCGVECKFVRMSGIVCLCKVEVQMNGRYLVQLWQPVWRAVDLSETFCVCLAAWPPTMHRPLVRRQRSQREFETSTDAPGSR